MCVRKGNATNAWALNNGFQAKLEYQTHQQLQCRSIILWRKLLSMAMGFCFIFVPYIGYISAKPRNRGIDLRPKSAPTFWGVAIDWISERLWKALGCLGLHTFRLVPYWTYIFFVFFCLKGTLPKVRCLLKATIFFLWYLLAPYSNAKTLKFQLAVATH